jgi:hypothetical protein
MAKSYSKLPLHASLVALGIAAGLASSPREAAAADPVRHTVSPGFMLSLSLGDKTAFGIGADVRYTAVFGLGGVGAFAQATVLPTSAGTAGRFAVGAHGGGALGSPLFGLDGELGYTYRTAFDEAHPGAHGIHVGLASYFLLFGELTVRGTIPWPGTKPEVTVGLGARFPPPFLPLVDLFGSPGRPLRIDGAHALPPVFASQRLRCAMKAPLDGETRAALAAAWLADARAEGSSVPAFLALADELRVLGAPRDLVDRALDAARDEVRHTRACLSIASDLADVDFTLGRVALPSPKGGPREDALVRLAVESFQDGCLGEGVAAATARRARGAVNAMIARDEQRHADLAWSVLAFCLSEGGHAVRDAVAAEVRSSSLAAPVVPAAPPLADPVGWAAYGRLDRDSAEASWEQTSRAARCRGEKLLSARP